MRKMDLQSREPAYRPTSLDFINRPNPVEPQAEHHKHPLHNAPSNSLDRGHLQRIEGSNLGHGSSSNALGPVFSGERPPKRQKTGGGPALDLDRPKLPPVRHRGEQRCRIPPTLSGLHQPPPDAGLLPSISFDGPRSTELPDRRAMLSGSRKGAGSLDSSTNLRADVSRNTPKANATKDTKLDGSATSAAEAKLSKARKSNRWSEEETNDLLKGVARFGVGSWTKILKCEDFNFERRTALDLKDRFRIRCPEQYTSKRPSRAKKGSKLGEERRRKSSEAQSDSEPLRETYHKAQSGLSKLGIDESEFVPSSRRRRTAYTKAEDDAIWAGFKTHGKVWAAIQSDEALGLDSRTPTDLRDRFRTKWPREYESAGLKVRHERIPKSQIREKDESQPSTSDHSLEEQQTNTSVDTTSKPRENVTRALPDKASREIAAAPAPAPARRTDPTFLSHVDDVFFGLPSDGEEERITLDRRILDWPFEFSKTPAAPSTHVGTLDSLSTLNLPMPSSLPAPANIATASQTATLPSLASVTAGSMSIDFGEQLELPSLMAGFGALEGEGGELRTVAQLMSLDEVLS